MKTGWHVCLGDTSVRKLHKLQYLKNGHAPESFLYRIIFANMFNDITNWERRRMNWLLTQQVEDLVIGVSVVQDQKILGNFTKNDHLTNLQTVNGTNSLSG